MPSTEPNHWLPRPLRRIAGRTLESVLNRALALDADAATSLERLEGRRIAVHLRGPDLGFAIEVRDGGLRVGPLSGESADLNLSATPGTLLALALPREDGALPSGKLEIAGDAELARRVEKIAREYAPDVEAAFARTFGEVLGVPIARVLREARDWTRTGARHFATDAADWLRDDARLAVPRGEMDDFLDDVDALRERAERLAARIARLAEKTA